MADLASRSNSERDIEQDEKSLIWISSNGERNLQLASVSRIIPGQRTAVFRRYLRPEKDYLSFSLIYNNGKRSLDLICKDKVETEIWIAGLRALISSAKDGRSKIDGWNDGGLDFHEHRDLISVSATTSSVTTIPGCSSPEVPINPHSMPSQKTLQTYSSTVSNSSNVTSEQTTNMQPNPPPSDALRFSISSGLSTSSHGLAQDESDTWGTVYVWGQVAWDINLVGPGPDGSPRPAAVGPDLLLLPRPLECSATLDVHRVACGARHTCGEFHTCAVTASGELYTWGEGTHSAELLGHGMGVGPRPTRRVSDLLEGLWVTSVACGPWHTALITSDGRLFTFGEGSFGVLGHGNRESVSGPKEVESLSGLRTVAVACGVWHTAAIVEVTHSSTSGKLFTWGDGDKNRLGQGDKEARLEPTCVPTLIDHNFQKIACGHSLTVGLTSSGQVFTMGSTVYGQLGNPKSDGKLPCPILFDETVEEIDCGAYHVAVLKRDLHLGQRCQWEFGSRGHGRPEDADSS